jgi:uncharacterized membrane protein
LFEITVRKSVFIDRPAEDVFARLNNLERMTGWSNALIAIEKLTPEEICPGTIVQCTVRFLGKQLDITFEIVEYEPARYLAFKSIAGCPPCLFSYQFDPVAGGGTNASEEARVHIVAELLEVTETAVSNAIHRQIEYDLLTLKDVVESSLSTGSR